jgi:non-specific serine/threonine protein kinase
MRCLGREVCAAVVASLAAAILPGVASAGAGWVPGPPLPVPRSEVASAVLDGRIVVLGGSEAEGASSRRVDSYDPATRRWSRLPDLPLAVNHAMAASDGKRIYLVGGYANGAPVRRAYVLDRGGKWRPLPLMPEARAAGGAAVVRGRLYVVGGVFARGRLARETLVYEPSRRQWSRIAGPSPREHLGVAALNGRIYAVGGRSAGFDTNLNLVEELRPGAGGWRELPSIPGRRGGTALAAARGQLVSVGGEEPGGTIPEVYSYVIAERRWERLADLPIPRHGLAVEAVRGRVFAIGGGEEPGLSVSGANEALTLRAAP